MSGNGNHGKQTVDEYIRELELRLYDGKFDGTANTEFCDCDKMEKKRWWYLPVALGLIALAYGLGWVSAAWSISL